MVVFFIFNGKKKVIRRWRNGGRAMVSLVSLSLFFSPFLSF